MKRLDQVIDIIIERFDSEEQVIHREHTVTDMIARNGVSILSRNRIPVGELVLFKTADGQFETSAVVKSARYSDDFIQRLTLEFVGDGWRRKWIYTQTGALHTDLDEFFETAQETAMLLQILFQDREQDQSPDQVFLSELQESVDRLRSMVFRIRQA